ncbi:uncharacterized protein [Eucyclogobius newberryi]|uniref:uncharacterized protein n=1 Tax=Eucyclogobius newberryi TaxID=166745 RepID=UPI003B5C15BD
MTMAFALYLSLLSTLVIYATAKYTFVPRGVDMTCHERYFMINVDQHFTGKNLRFEAVDKNGSHAITEGYAAKCGYSIRFIHSKTNVQLRASYFSCHTDQAGEVYTFHFNLIAHHKGKEVTHALNRSCSPSLPWSLREVTCEVNYMEVSVRSEISCSSSTTKNDWDNLKLGHSPSPADWQVTFQKRGEQLRPTSLKEARSQSYVFDLISGRLVFRTPYGQNHSFTSVIDGIPVEVVHATLFSRESWLVLLFDLVAACSVYEATFEDEEYMLWETPDVLYPGLHATNFSFGLNGNLMQPSVAETKGYLMEKHNRTVEVSIPHDAEGAHRKSVVSGDLYEICSYDFYTEQLSVDEDGVETRLRTHKTMVTPLLMRTLKEENHTVPEMHHFTIYLGDVPQDVDLISLALNGHQFQVPLKNNSTFSMANVVHPNDTHGYTLKVPFYKSPVIQQFSMENIKFKLDINYTLMVLPEQELYHHFAAFVAILPNLAPPQFDASCSESNVRIKFDKPFDSKWEITIGPDPLTAELATRLGFVLSNNSHALELVVPLLSSQSTTTNFSLQGFTSTFEIHVRHRETSKVQSSTVKTCPFFANELLVCSTDMRMTAVVNLSLAVASGGVPAKMKLRDQSCGPKEADATKALFTFPMNACGSIVKLGKGKGTVTYENEIIYSKQFPSEDADRVLLQCTYPVSSLHRLFSKITFESDTPGVGHIIHTSPSATALPSTTKSPDVIANPHEVMGRLRRSIPQKSFLHHLGVSRPMKSKRARTSSRSSSSAQSPTPPTSTNAHPALCHISKQPQPDTNPVTGSPERSAD